MSKKCYHKAIFTIILQSSQCTFHSHISRSIDGYYPPGSEASMAKQKYEMKTERSQKMNEEGLLQLSGTVLAPYMQLSTALIGKARHAGDFFKFFHFF